jgi:hypothetical protein
MPILVPLIAFNNDEYKDENALKLTFYHLQKYNLTNVILLYYYKNDKDKRTTKSLKKKFYKLFPTFIFHFYAQYFTNIYKIHTRLLKLARLLYKESDYNLILNISDLCNFSANDSTFLFKFECQRYFISKKNCYQITRNKVTEWHNFGDLLKSSIIEAFEAKKFVFLQQYFKMIYFSWSKFIWSPNNLGGVYTKKQITKLFD